MEKSTVLELLGENLAQDDPNFLKYHLPRKGIIKRLSDKAEKIIVLNAARGSGKSGVLLQIEHLLKNKSLLIKKYNGDISLTGNVLDTDDFTLQHYVNYWENEILGWIFSSIGQELVTALSSDTINAVEFAEYKGKKPKNIIGLLFDKLEIKKSPIKKASSNPVVRAPEVFRLIEGYEKPVWILLDEMDDNYTNSQNDKKKLIGLFEAVKWISRKCNNIYIRLTIRPHILTILETESDTIQLLHDHFVSIQWRAKQLRSILARRIDYYHSHPKGDDRNIEFDNPYYSNAQENAIIARFFDNFDMSFKACNRDVYHTLATIAFYRPRLLIEYCKEAFIFIEPKGRITPTIAAKAMHNYGHSRLRQTQGEHHFLFKDIQTILNEFFNLYKTNLGDSNSLKKIIEERIVNNNLDPFQDDIKDARSLKVARFLYMIEFIRGHERLDRYDGHRYIYFTERPDMLTSWYVRKSIKWHIHPSYAKALKLDDDKTFSVAGEVRIAEKPKIRPKKNKGRRNYRWR